MSLKSKAFKGTLMAVDTGLAIAIATKGVAFCATMTSGMGAMGLFTLYSGGALIGGEALAYYFKNKTNNHDKLASGHLIDKYDIEDILGTDGLILSKDIQLRKKYDYEGSCTFGSTGSGKSTSIFAPNLLSNNIEGSIIVTDPKGELFKMSSAFQEKVCGRKVLKFCPLEPQISEKYNLLTSCKSSSEVVELASTLLFNGILSIELATGKKSGGSDSTWIQMAEPLLASALLYAKDLEFPFNNVEFAFKLIISLKSKQLEAIIKGSNNIDAITQFDIFNSVGGADRTEGSIKITLASNLKLFTDYRVNATGIENTFNIEDFRKEPTILYVCYPEHKSSYLAPFIAPFFSQVMSKLIEGYSDISLPIHLLFDEFANVGMLSNMSTSVSTIRSREISMNICLQSITQLFQIYGRENGKAILNNLKTKLVFPSLSDEDTLNYISNLCGNKEITTCNTNINKASTTHSYSKTKIKLFEGSELRCLEDEQLLIITSNKQPIITTQNRYYTNSIYTNNIHENTTYVKRNNITKFDIDKKITQLKLGMILENEEEEIDDIKKDLFNE